MKSKTVVAKTVLGALALSVALPAAAARPEAKVEYAADSSAETAQGAVQGRVFHAPGKERREMNAGGERTVTIARMDKQVTWMLMPEQKAYVEMPLGNSPDRSDVSGWEVEQTVVGPEVLDGVKTTKSKVIARSPSDGKMGGFWWTTAEGVTVKMDMLSVEKGSKTRIKMELRNLKVGKQDPALFEIPTGYTRMQVPGMGGMPGSGAMSGMAAAEGQAQGPQEKGEKKRAPSAPSLKDLPGLFK